MERGGSEIDLHRVIAHGGPAYALQLFATALSELRPISFPELRPGAENISLISVPEPPISLPFI